MISGRKGARRLGKLPAALPNLEKSGLHIRRIHHGAGPTGPDTQAFVRFSEA